MNCLVITPLFLFLPHISEIHTSFAERMAANGIAQLLFPNIIAAEFAQIPFIFLNGFTIHNALGNHLLYWDVPIIPRSRSYALLQEYLPSAGR